MNTFTATTADSSSSKLEATQHPTTACICAGRELLRMNTPTKRHSGVRRQQQRSQQDFRDRCSVTCRLQRNTFLPGEEVLGTIKFGVPSQDQGSVDIEQATVQAHGYVKVDPRWISLPASLRSLFKQEAGSAPAKHDIPVPRYSGLDDDRSACVFASEVAVLVKKERVDREDPASFSFSFVLPETLTPTFRGVGVRYAYAVTVRIRRALPPPAATGRLFGLVRRRPAAPASGGVSTKDLHVAFTVLSRGDVAAAPAVLGSGGVGILGAATAATAANGWGEGRGGAGWEAVPFAELEVERQSSEALNLASERAKAGGLISGTRTVTWNMQGRELDDGPGSVAAAALLLGESDAGNEHLPPPPMVYSIRSGDNRIGSFILHKADFCAGDIVLGNFDFSGASTRCLQVCACLEVWEENAFSGNPEPLTPGSRKAPGSGRSSCHKRVVDSCKELTPCMVQSSVTLSLPMDAPVTFSTELVSVSWRLRFEFVIAPPESRWAIGGSSPSKSSVLPWSVPIRVVPPPQMVFAGGPGVGREVGVSAMDATGKTVFC